MMNVTVLKRDSRTSVGWTMLFRDQSFGKGNVDAIITCIQQHYMCEVGDELIVIMDDKVKRVKMVPATLEAEWLPMKRET